MLQLLIVKFMPSLDIAMPIALLIVITLAVFLNKRVENKLKATVEEKEFQTRDVILLIVVMSIVISVIAYTSFLNPGEVFENVLLAIFLGAYSMLLFTFSYIFSNLKRIRAQLFSLIFGIISLSFGAISLLGPLADGTTIIRSGAFFGLATFCFAVIIYEQIRSSVKEKWYIALQPPAMFLLLFVFFNLVYTGSVSVWYPILMDTFGLTFAVLIILYLGSLFNWKTVGLFAVLLTILDIILVFSGPMVAAAKTFTGLGLPVLVYLPNVPLITVPSDFTGVTFFGFGARGLGLGDFFFAGILAAQTYKKFGKKVGIAAILGMTLAFGIWEAFLPEILEGMSAILGTALKGFPGTLMIITGWAPIVAIALLLNKRKQKIQ